MDFKPSEYQERILDYFRTHPSSNMLVEALAGAGKSSTACLLTEHTTSSDVYVAFNASIANEFKERIQNPKTKVYTLHSLAFLIMNTCLKGDKGTQSKSGGFGTSRNDGAVLDNLKVYKIVEKELEKQDKYISFNKKVFLEDGYVKLYNLCRLTLTDMADKDKVARIIEDYNLFVDYDFGFSSPGIFDVLLMLGRIEAKSMDIFDKQKTVDFTDMLYITYTKVKNKEWRVPPWNLYTNIFVDECQDLNNLQLSFLPYVRRKGGRFVFIGDSHQAIYNFSGADAKAFSSIPKRFKPMTSFPLPVCYRCPTSHLDYVNRQFMVGILPRPNAPKGEIKDIEKCSIPVLAQPGDMVVARKNKWLASVIISLATHEVPVVIEDKDFVASIKKIVDKTKATSVTTFIKSCKDKIGKLNDKVGSTTDVDNLAFISKIASNYLKKNENGSLTDFKIYLDQLLRTTPNPKAVRLCSVHKAKGLEAENVFVLNRGKVCFDSRNTPEMNLQEKNLSYVSLTRAKNIMYLVTEEKP